MLEVKILSWITVLFMSVSALASDAGTVALSFDGKVFREQFNTTASNGRLVAILSPT